MTSEADLQSAIRLAIARECKHMRMFRNNVGEAWAGKVLKTNEDRTILLRDPYRVVYGLALGSSDLIGWTSMLVTPEMVGHRVAIFTSGEVKLPGKPLPEHQQKWLRAVKEAGGIGRTLRSIEDGVKLGKWPT